MAVVRLLGERVNRLRPTERAKDVVLSRSA
jgi:hypothetical protein